MTTDTKATPDWDEYGNLPAIGEQQPTSRERSPYAISLVDLVASFATTEHRRGLLIGFLAFRAALHEAGLVRGFQWVDGSFVQNIEETDGLAPNDIDVVTFFYIPDDGSTGEFSRDFRELFDRRIMREGMLLIHIIPNSTKPRQKRSSTNQCTGIAFGRTPVAVDGRVISR